MKKSPSPSKPKASSSATSSPLKALKAQMKKKMRSEGGQSQRDDVLDETLDVMDEGVAAAKAAGLWGRTALITAAEEAQPDPMLAHRCTWDEAHIEGPQRLSRARQRCRELGLEARCVKIAAREAEDDELEGVHDKEYLDRLAKLTASSEEAMRNECLGREDDPSFYMCAETLSAARTAAAAAIDLASAVATGENGIRNGLALVRPPGHHAGKSRASGFCFVNNVAVAARRLLSQRLAEKIMIVDLDVHFGQGTQREFYDEPRVLYTSIHRYEHGRFWPHLREADFDHVGVNGTSVNLPINETGLDVEDYMALFQQIVMPIGFAFSPDIVLVSSGYDAAVGCPEGRMRLSPAAYGHIFHNLSSLANGRMAVVLEGGYFVESQADGVAMTLHALLGDQPPQLGPLPPPKESTVTTILNALSALRPYWPSLRLQGQYCISEYDPDQEEGQQCHEPIVFYYGEEMLAARAASHGGGYNAANYYEANTPEQEEEYLKQLETLRTFYEPQLNSVGRGRVAIVHDEAMTRHRNIAQPKHPEQPDRIRRIVQTMEGEFKLLSAREELYEVPSRRATRKEIELVHSPALLDRMDALMKVSQKERDEKAADMDSIYFCEDTLDCALLAAGSILNVVDEVVEGRAQSGGLAVVRPPGHHAEVDESCGFCIFNNVAVAAKYAVERHGMKRVLVLDWDVHHGNGIQNIFYDDDRVLYFSQHRYLVLQVVIVSSPAGWPLDHPVRSWSRRRPHTG